MKNILIILIVFLSFTAKAQSWTKLSDSVRLWGVDGPELLYIPEQDSIYLFGGWNGDSIPASNGQVYKYDRNMQHGRRLKDAPWQLHCYGAGYQNDSFFVFGGDAENVNIQNYYVYKISTGVWTLLQKDVVSPRKNYASAWFKGKPYIIGGLTNYSTDSTNCPNDVVTGPAGSGTWTTIAKGFTQFGGILSGTASQFNGYLYQFAGVGWATDEQNRNYKVSVWRSADGIKWERRADIPFNSSNWFGKGRGFIKVCPSYDGKSLGLFFGYQRVPGRGVEDFFDSYVMDTSEKWTQLPYFPGTGRNGSRHAPGVCAVKDGWVITCGRGIPMKFDAWHLKFPIDATVTTGGNLGELIIGTRDSNAVKIIIQDTTRLAIYKDSTVFLSAQYKFYDNREQSAQDREITKWSTISKGQTHLFKTPNDLGYIRFAETQGGVTGGWRITGKSNIPTFSMYNTGRIHLSPNNVIADASDAFLTVTSPSSNGTILRLRNAGGTTRLNIRDDGSFTVNQAPGDFIITNGQINGTVGFKVGTMAGAPLSFIVGGFNSLNISKIGVVEVPYKFKINSVPLTAVPQPGTIENDGLHLYYTNSLGQRLQLDQQPCPCQPNFTTKTKLTNL